MMKIKFYNNDFDVPDLLVEKFIKEYDSLPGSGMHEEINMLRDSIGSVCDIIAKEPELLHEREFMTDFMKALAMKKAMETHGIFYDA
jgi:hypothetical protein